MSKTTLFGLTKAAAKDLAREGIRVNCLAPGIIQTKFSAAVNKRIMYYFRYYYFKSSLVT